MPPHGLPSAADVVDVWRDAGPGQWFNGGAAFDALCRERFGRFPHRNRVLGRTNTAQEQAYLDAGGGF